MPDLNVTRNRPLLTTSQAAEALGIATTTLDKWRVKKRGPVYLKIGVVTASK